MITYRALTTLEDCRHFQEVQARIWGRVPDEIVPLHVLVTQAKNGGFLWGAFAQEGPEETGGMVGIALGWPAFGTLPSGERRLKLCSHIVGVLPAWQGHGIGLALKRIQREEMLAQGWTDWITWTYDPLQRVNGRFNIHRLGATCRTYLRNVYGEMTDRLNRGLPSDRCQVDWHLASPRVAYALADPAPGDVDWRGLALEMLSTRSLPGRPELREPLGGTPTLDGRPLAVPLPESVEALRAHSLSLLLEWRFALRAALEAAFQAGYVLVDCVCLEGEWRYILVPEALHPFPHLPWP